MPIPQPNDGESREEFIPRCMKALAGDDSPNDQKVAICETTYSEHRKKKANESVAKHITLEAGAIKAIAKGKQLLLTGPLLRPGTWVGLDGVPTRYSPELISKIYPTLVGTPIRFAHKASPDSMEASIPPGTTAGFWTRSKANKAGELKGRGMVFHEGVIKYLEAHPNTKLSAELDAVIKHLPDGSDDIIDAVLTGGALTDDPAVQGSADVSFRQITLERGILKMETKPIVAFDATGKNDQAEYSKWLEASLTNAKVPAEDIKKVVEALSKVTEPYKIPPPEVKAPDPLPTEIQEFIAYTKVANKPFPEMIKAYVSEKFNQAPPEDLTKKVTELTSQLGEVTSKLNQRMKEDVDSVVAEIKELDKDFKAEKLLEGVKEFETQKKMLEAYATQLKKNIKPIHLQLSPEEAKTKVETVAKEMFGTPNMTVEGILGLPEKKTP